MNVDIVTAKEHALESTAGHGATPRAVGQAQPHGLIGEEATVNLKRYLRARIVSALNADLQDCLVGRFDEERRADTNHHCRRGAYVAAFGVFGPIEESPIRGNEKVWDMVLRMFDRICDWQKEDGWWRWYQPDTRKMYATDYHWAAFSWMRLLQDFGDRIDAPRRARIEKMLRLTIPNRLTKAREYLDTGRHQGSKNIFFACSLELWMAGKFIDERAWRTTAEEAIERAAATQFEDGYWPDGNIHRGPTTRYNFVSLRSLSAYARMSGSESVRRTVARAAEYHRRLSYPDGSSVETVDERNRYSPGRMEGLAFCLAPFPETRPTAALFAGEAEVEPDEGKSPPGAIEIDSWAATPDEEVEPKPLKEETLVLQTIPAAVARMGPWYACLSGATTTIPSRQFHHDLQCHLSLWRDGLGLVAGGGNSLLDPRFSTFRFQGTYLAEKGAVEANKDGAMLRLTYGGIKAEVELSFDDDRTARFVAHADGPLPPDSEFALQLPGLFGRKLVNETYVSLGLEFPLVDWAFWRTLPEADNRFRIGALLFAADRPMNVMWPCDPAHIYDPPARLPLESAVLRVAVALSEGPATLTVRSEES